MKPVKFKVFIVFSTILFAVSSYGQEVIIKDINDQVLSKYIDLAIKNFPRKKAFDATVERAKAQISVAALGILDIFNAGYYYRPENQQGVLLVPGGGGTNSGNGSIVTQGFNAGVTVNLGTLLSRPAMIKAAKADYKFAIEQSNEYNTTLATEVKGRYYDFLAAKKQLELRSLAARDLKSNLNNAQVQFQNGQTTIEAYTIAKNASIESEALALTAEVTFLKAKNALEDIIGVKLEAVK
ncbi:MAG: TolC family protein [Niabella sp.]